MRILLLLATLLFITASHANEDETVRYTEYTREQMIVLGQVYADAAFCNNIRVLTHIDRQLTDIFTMADELRIIVVTNGQPVPYSRFFYPMFDQNKDLRYMMLLLEALDDKRNFCYNMLQNMDEIKHNISRQHAVLTTILMVLDDERQKSEPKDEGIRG